MGTVVTVSPNLIVSWAVDFFKIKYGHLVTGSLISLVYRGVQLSFTHFHGSACLIFAEKPIHAST
jgi:hypothetical protein